jgi:hypothetical protein
MKKKDNHPLTLKELDNFTKKVLLPGIEKIFDKKIAEFSSGIVRPKNTRYPSFKERFAYFLSTNGYTI